MKLHYLNFLVYLLEKPCVILYRCLRFRICSSKHLLSDEQGSLVQLSCLPVVALRLVEQRQVMERLCRLWMLWPENLLAHGK